MPALTLEEVKNGDYPDREERAELLELPNVIGHGIGYREVDGERTDEIAVRVYVETKVPDTQLASAERIPTAVGGIQTDVVENGGVVDESTVKGSRANVMRPAMGGLVSSQTRGQGSIGGFFYSPDHGQYVGVHCRHVFREADDTDPCIGETVYQPQDVESETRDLGDVIAESPPGTSDPMDAVYFDINDNSYLTNRFPGGGSVVEIQEPQLDVRIQGAGARTGVTGGRIIALDVTLTRGGEDRDGYTEYVTDKAGGDSGSLMGHITADGDMIAIGIHTNSSLLGTSSYIVPFSEMEANADLGSLEALPASMDTHDDFNSDDDGYIECHPRHVDYDWGTSEYVFETFVTNTGGSTRTDTVELYANDTNTGDLTDVLQSHSVTLDPAEWTIIQLKEPAEDHYDEWLLRTTDQHTAFTNDDIASNLRYFGVEMGIDTEIYPTSTNVGVTPTPATATATGGGASVSSGQVTTVTTTPTGATDTAQPAAVTAKYGELVSPAPAGEIGRAQQDITTTATQAPAISPPPATASDSSGRGGQDSTSVDATVGLATVEAYVRDEGGNNPVEGATVHILDREAHSVIATRTADEDGYVSVTIDADIEVQLVAEYHDGAQAYQARQHTAYAAAIDSPFHMRLSPFAPGDATQDIHHATREVSGSVLLDGAGVSDATVTALATDTGEIFDQTTTDTNGYTLTVPEAADAIVIAKYRTETQAYQARQRHVPPSETAQTRDLTLYEFEPSHADVGVTASIPITVGAPPASATATATPVDDVRAIPIHATASTPTATVTATVQPVTASVGQKIQTPAAAATDTAHTPTIADIENPTVTPLVATTTATAHTPTVADIENPAITPPAAATTATAPTTGVISRITATVGADPAPPLTTSSPEPQIVTRTTVTAAPSPATASVAYHDPTHDAEQIIPIHAPTASASTTVPQPTVIDVSPIETLPAAIEGVTTVADVDAGFDPGSQATHEAPEIEPEPDNHRYRRKAPTRTIERSGPERETIKAEPTSVWTPDRRLTIDGTPMEIDHTVRVSATEYGFAVADCSLYNLDAQTWNTITRDDTLEIELGWTQGSLSTVFEGNIAIKRRERARGGREYVIRARASGADIMMDTHTYSFNNLPPHRIVEQIVTETPGLGRGYIGTGSDPIDGSYAITSGKELGDWFDRLAKRATDQTDRRWVWYLEEGKLYFHPEKEATTDPVTFRMGDSITRATPTGQVRSDETQQAYDAQLRCEPIIKRGLVATLGGVPATSPSNLYRVANYVHESSTVDGYHHTNAMFKPLFAERSDL